MEEARRRGECEDVKEQDPHGSPLPEDSIILGGRYRLVRLLHRRPRVNLYLARRLSSSRECIQHDEERGPLVAIRELVLSGFSPAECAQIAQAAFEEFVSPVVLGAPRLPGAGDRVRIEGDRHYLVMQLRGTRGMYDAVAVTLAELLVASKHWPSWLQLEIALGWGIQLCRIVARLQRLGAVLGDLSPATVLVDAERAAEWAPVLLVSWPPPPRFWATFAAPSNAIIERCRQKFPAPCLAPGNPFAAPEMLSGAYDARSDVYSLGALLYLLLTRYAPATAARRQVAAMQEGRVAGEPDADSDPGDNAGGMALAPPRLLNSQVPLELERALLRALALDPDERHPSAFALVEDLEAVALRQGVAAPCSPRRVSRVEKVLDWLKRELDS